MARPLHDTRRNWDVIQEQSKAARPCSATNFRGEPVNCGGHWFRATSANRIAEALYMATTTDSTQLSRCVNLFIELLLDGASTVRSSNVAVVRQPESLQRIARSNLPYCDVGTRRCRC